MKMDYIYAGDAMELLTRMPTDYVDIVITDPPYDFDEKTKLSFLREMKRVSKGAVILFAPPENLWSPQSTDQFCFWVKPISTKNTSRSYSRFVEVIQIFGRCKLCSRSTNQRPF